MIPNPNSIEFLSGLNRQLAEENKAMKSRLESGGGDGTSGGMNLVNYRLDQSEKRAEAAAMQMARVEEKVNTIHTSISGLATRDTMRNWGIAVASIVIATGLAVAALLLQAGGNQLSAFQAGLSAIQTVVSVSQVPAAPPSNPTVAPTNPVPASPPPATPR